MEVFNTPNTHTELATIQTRLLNKDIAILKKNIHNMRYTFDIIIWIVILLIQLILMPK